MPDEDSVMDLWQRMQDGDDSAIPLLWNRYFPRMVALARQSIAAQARSRTDPEDAAQSAFFSFWELSRERLETSLQDRNQLWKLLARITVRKVIKSLRRDMAEKRGSGRTIGEAGFADDEMRLDQMALAASSDPEVDVIVDELIDGLEEDLRPFVLMRLMGYRNAEIAEVLECTERTVERKLGAVRMVWLSQEGD